MSEIKLKPCPFCGGEAKIRTATTGGLFLKTTGFYVKCKICRASSVAELTEEEAVEAWNTREPMERIVERLKEKSVLRANSEEFWNNPQNGEYVDEVVKIEDAIEIVKGGAE